MRANAEQVVENSRVDVSRALARAEHAENVSKPVHLRLKTLETRIDESQKESNRLRSENESVRANAEQVVEKSRVDVSRALARAERAENVSKPVYRHGARVTDVRFNEIDGKAVVELMLSGAARYEILEQSADKAVLRIENAALPEALERSLDTSEFGGAVTMVSTFRSHAPAEENDVRMVVNLRRGIPNRLKRTESGFIWEFGAALVPQRVESLTESPAAPGAAAIPEKMRYYPNMVGQASTGGAAAAYTAASPAPANPAAAYTAASSAPANPSGIQNPFFEKKKKRKKYKGKRINLTIKDADIQHVLTFLAKEGRVNIVAGDEVQGNVTFHLENIPWDLALDMILKAKGFDYVKEQGVYRVALAETINKEVEMELEKKAKLRDLRQLVVRLLPVNYADATALADQVGKILSTRGSAAVDERTNTLIIKDTEDYIVAAEDLVRRLDTQTPQVLIEARIVEVSTNFTRDVGIQWGGNFAMSPVFGNETGLAFPSVVGVSGGASGTVPLVDGLFTNNPGFAVNLPAPAGEGAGGALGLTLGTLSGSANLSLRLSAQEEEGNVKIISSPRISTMDNKSATIRQGVQIPISVVSAQGVNTQFFNADLQLEVTPHVTQDGNIALEIAISKNEPNFGQTGANGNPTIQTKEATTELLLRDGDTTVIGGIYTRNFGENYSKLPGLGDIPIFGWLFKTKSATDQRSELLIFITPRIINRPASIQASR